MLAIVWRAAKPITRPSTALDARIPVASRWILAKLLSASAAPISRMTTKTRRRTSRSRVCGGARDAAPRVTLAATCPARAITSRSTDECDRDRDRHRDQGRDQIAVLLPEASADHSP